MKLKNCMNVKRETLNYKKENVIYLKCGATDKC